MERRLNHAADRNVFKNDSSTVCLFFRWVDRWLFMCCDVILLSSGDYW